METEDYDEVMKKIPMSGRKPLSPIFKLVVEQIEILPKMFSQM